METRTIRSICVTFREAVSLLFYYHLHSLIFLLLLVLVLLFLLMIEGTDAFTLFVSPVAWRGVGSSKRLGNLFCGVAFNTCQRP